MATDQENTRDKEGQCCQKCDDKTCSFDKRQYNRKMIRLLIERANYLSKLYGYPIYGTVLKRVSWDQASGFVEKDLVVLADGAGGGYYAKSTMVGPLTAVRRNLSSRVLTLAKSMPVWILT
jgi:hypothetical protein